MEQSNKTNGSKKRVFLDIDDLSRWDGAGAIIQRFPMAEKVQISGLKPGPAGSCDARCCDYPSVFYEDGKFRMWYSCMPDALSYEENADHVYNAYAESDDGITWTKPNLGITGKHKFPGNNLLALPGVCCGVVRALSGSKYKYLAMCIQILPLEEDITDVPGNSYDGGGSFIFGSNDGFHWTQLAMVCRHGDNGMLFADHQSGRYLLYQKVGVLQGLQMHRSFIGMESDDGINWKGYNGFGKWNECFVADEYDDMLAARRGFKVMDYYGTTIHRVGDLYISIENCFTIGTPLVNRYAQSPSGLCYLRLGFSHNGFNWRHPYGRPVWLETGAPGDFDAGFIAPGLNLVEYGDEMRLYYAGFRYIHGWCITEDFRIRTDIPLSEQRGMGEIGMARIKRDRFACLASTYRGRFEMNPDATGAEPLTVNPTCPHLFINTRCPNGAVRVALGAYGKEGDLPGFSFDDCVPFTGDSVRAPVRFKNASIAELSPDTRFYLKFDLYRAEIFGYEWGN